MKQTQVQRQTRKVSKPGPRPGPPVVNAETWRKILRHYPEDDAR